MMGDKFDRLRTKTAQLPIWSHLEQLEACFAQNNRVLLKADPGAGKSSIVPLIMSAQPWANGGKLIVLQPRRLAARAVATRMSELSDCSVGTEIGYRIRHQACVSAQTRIEVITEGILLRMMQTDPELSGVVAIIFDEFHERSLHSELALAFALDIQDTLRPDLKLLLMSATLDIVGLESVLGGICTLELAGVSYPVVIEYRGKQNLTGVAQQLLQEISTGSGDILVFLPGLREIEQVKQELQKSNSINCEIHRLHGSLPYLEQQRALLLSSSGKRKVILSTSIAETSLTIAGITTVADSGLQRLVRYDSGLGFDRFFTEDITQDSATQRAGRAGRLGPGRCLRFWGEHQQQVKRQSLEPEILRADLCSLALELAAWGVEDPAKLQFIQQPPDLTFGQARELLIQLEAISHDGSISDHGRQMLAFGLHPRIAHMVLKSGQHGAYSLASDIAALLSEREIVSQSASFGADLEVRLNAMNAQRRGQRISAVSSQSLQAVLKEAKKISQRLACADAGESETVSSGLLLSYAYPERIAKKGGVDGRDLRFSFAGGGGGAIDSSDPLAKAKYLVAARVERISDRNLIRLAAEISEEDVRQAHRARIIESDTLYWDAKVGLLRAEKCQLLGKLLLSRQTIAVGDSAAATEILCQVLRDEKIIDRYLQDKEIANFTARVRLVAALVGELEFPDFSSAELIVQLENWLAPTLVGITSLSELNKLDIKQLLHAQLSWQQVQALNSLAPQELILPNGRSRKLSYRLSGSRDDSAGEIVVAVLSATVQELLGWSSAPRIGGGKISLTLEILSPARRPIQTTTDLEGFWSRTYPQVRKELRGRYPKHKWPEEPQSG